LLNYGYRQQQTEWTTDVGGFLVVIVVGDVSREAEVGNLQHVVLSDENISRRQVAMYALHTHSHSHALLVGIHPTQTAVLNITEYYAR